jgi:hypothetical protein
LNPEPLRVLYKCGVCDCAMVADDMVVVETTNGDSRGWICPSCLTGIESFAHSPYLIMSALRFMFKMNMDRYEVRTHVTEDRRPKQTAEFIKVITSMYFVHLSKNKDYSPANILATGSIGVVTRVWDKVARLMNLTGFKVEIASSSFEAPQTPSNESIQDSWMDLSVYGIIAQILNVGAWGK